MTTNPHENRPRAVPTEIGPAPSAGLRTVPKLAVAIAGAGLMGQWHADAARRTGGQTVGVLDIDSGRAAALARRHGAEPFSDLDRMIDTTQPDVLHICAPTGLHDKMIRQAVARGVNVFVEKPLAQDVAATRDAVEQAKAVGVQLCPVHQYAFQNSVARITKRLKDLGDVIDVELRFYSAGAAGADPQQHPGIAADILPHPASILQRLFPAERLDQACWCVRADAPETWHLSTSLGGVQVRILLSLAARPTCATLGVAGRAGSFHADLFHDFVIFMDGTANRRTKIYQPLAHSSRQFAAAASNLAARALRRETAYPGLRTLTSAFYAACRGEAPAPISAAEICAVAALRDQFLRTVGTSGTPSESNGVTP